MQSGPLKPTVRNKHNCKHKEQQWVVTINVSSFGALRPIASKVVEAYRIACIQEHRLVGGALGRELRHLASLGVKGWFAPALTTNKLSTSSGVGFLWGPGTSLQGAP